MNKVVIELSGGLANQIFQYYFSLYLARSFDYINPSISFSLNWYDLSSRKSHEVFRLAELITQIEITSIHPRLLFMLRFAFLRFFISYLPDYFFHFLGFHIFSNVKNSSSSCIAKLHTLSFSKLSFIYLRGHWQDSFSRIFNPLVLNQLISNLNCSLLQTEIPAIDYARGVCLHVRRGDYLTNTSIGLKTHTPLNNSYYVQSLILVRKLLANPIFYIYSDDPEWCHCSSLFPVDSIYITRSDSLSDVSIFKSMTLFSNFIIANSSFSFWAYLLSLKKNILIYPRSYRLCDFTVTENNDYFSHYIQGI